MIRSVTRRDGEAIYALSSPHGDATRVVTFKGAWRGMRPKASTKALICDLSVSRESAAKLLRFHKAEGRRKPRPSICISCGHAEAYGSTAGGCPCTADDRKRAAQALASVAQGRAVL